MDFKTLTEYLKPKKLEAFEMGYFLHAIMERDGIVVVDFKAKTFSPAQCDGDGRTLNETMNNLLLLGYTWNEDSETCPSMRWWSDFEILDLETEGTLIQEQTDSDVVR